MSTIYTIKLIPEGTYLGGLIIRQVEGSEEQAVGIHQASDVSSALKFYLNPANRMCEFLRSLPVHCKVEKL